ncbi:MAG: sigma-54 dependent transcriptional regulator [Muribaculaceae bacterium]|nr:sigma-54 dependent transcriptional regulator [Muribaculaceae bacterium]
MAQDLTTYDIDPEVTRAKQRLGIVGNAPELNRAVERALRVAPIDLSVLVTGESGSGKEFFPRIIHLYSPRKHNKYIAVNCGAIPEGTIDSELFGHEKGAFTGAIASRKGYFEEANGGTIFLDEVAELPLTTQARLLRVLESGEFIKVGSSEVQKTNIRVVAATNVDMAKAVAEGRFREDLFYRLSTVQIQVPALRDRGADIMLLARKFAADFSEKYRMPRVTFGDEARIRMLHYSWPGNVRQLKNVVEQVALFDAGREINGEEIASYLPHIAAGLTPAVASKSDSYEREREMLFNMIFRLQREIDTLREEVKRANTSGEPQIHSDFSGRIATGKGSISSSLMKYNDHIGGFLSKDPAESPNAVEEVEAIPTPTLEDTEREMIKASLERHNGHRKAAATELNISERTLYRKIKEYGLD